MQNLRNDKIGVSKLCCPVCWDLLLLLKAKYIGKGEEDVQAFNVRGRHPMLYEVELPLGLPLDILQAMVETYELKLYDQLFSLSSETRYQNRHKRTHSSQSDRSVNSAVSGTLDEDVFKNDIAEGIESKRFLDA